MTITLKPELEKLAAEEIEASPRPAPSPYSGQENYRRTCTRKKIDSPPPGRYSQVESAIPMKVDLTPELEQLVEGKVKSGHYASASEVVQEALKLLEQRDTKDTGAKNEIRDQIEQGWQSARRGELVDGGEVFDRIDAELALMERSTPG